MPKQPTTTPEEVDNVTQEIEHVVTNEVLANLEPKAPRKFWGGMREMMDRLAASGNFPQITTMQTPKFFALVFETRLLSGGMSPAFNFAGIHVSSEAETEAGIYKLVTLKRREGTPKTTVKFIRPDWDSVDDVFKDDVVERIQHHQAEKQARLMGAMILPEYLQGKPEVTFQAPGPGKPYLVHFDLAEAERRIVTWMANETARFERLRFPMMGFVTDPDGAVRHIDDAPHGSVGEGDVERHGLAKFLNDELHLIEPGFRMNRTETGRNIKPYRPEFIEWPSIAKDRHSNDALLYSIMLMRIMARFENNMPFACPSFLGNIKPHLTHLILTNLTTPDKEMNLHNIKSNLRPTIAAGIEEITKLLKERIDLKETFDSNLQKHKEWEFACIIREQERNSYVEEQLPVLLNGFTANTLEERIKLAKDAAEAIFDQLNPVPVSEVPGFEDMWELTLEQFVGRQAFKSAAEHLNRMGAHNVEQCITLGEGEEAREYKITLRPIERVMKALSSDQDCSTTNGSNFSKE